MTPTVRQVRPAMPEALIAEQRNPWIASALGEAGIGAARTQTFLGVTIRWPAASAALSLTKHATAW